MSDVAHHYFKCHMGQSDFKDYFKNPRCLLDNVLVSVYIWWPLLINKTTLLCIRVVYLLSAS